MTAATLKNTGTSVINLIDFKTARKEAEDVKYREASQSVKKKVSVIYNNFSVEAILSASILKHCYPEFNYISAAQLIDPGYEMYVWIGVSPENLAQGNLVARDIDHRYYNGHEKYQADEDGIRPGIIEKICEDFNVTQNGYVQRIAFKAQEFFKKNAILSDLAEVYQEVLLAIQHLTGKDNNTNIDPVVNYMRVVKEVKTAFQKSYLQTSAPDKNRSRKVILTHFSDHNFIIALRLMKLAHADFINQTVGMNGPLVYSSMDNPKIFTQQEQDRVVMLT